MEDKDKSQEQLIQELNELRQRVSKQEKLRSHNKQTEKELSLFKSIIESSKEAIAIFNKDGNFIYVNPAHENLFGRKLEDSKFLHFEYYFTPESRAKINHDIQPSLALGEDWEGELEVVDTIARRFPIWQRFNSILDTEDNLLYSFSFMHDITRRKQNEHELENHRKQLKKQVEERTTELRKSREEYRQLVETMNEGLYILDNQKMITYVNDMLCQMFGYSKEEIVGHSPNEFMDSHNIEIFNKMLTESMIDKHKSYELVFQHKDKSKIYVIASPSKKFNDEGKVTGSFAVLTNITQRKHTEEQLRERERIADALLNAPNESAFLLDVHGKILDASQIAAQRFMLTVNQIIGQNIADLLSPDLFSSRNTWFNKVIKSRNAVHFEDQRADMWLSNTMYPVVDEHDEVVKVVWFSVNISQTKKLESELARVSYKIHNSLKNKLESARNYLDDYLESKNRTINDLGIVEKLISHCSDESRNILFVTSHKECNLKKLTEELELRAELNLSYTNISYFFTKQNYASNGDIILNPAVIQYILDIYNELLNNIVKHSCASEVDIVIFYTEGSLNFSVHDDGIGFDYKSCLAKDDSYGLEIMQALTKEIKATMQIISYPGKGTDCEIKVRIS